MSSPYPWSIWGNPDSKSQDLAGVGPFSLSFAKFLTQLQEVLLIIFIDMALSEADKQRIIAEEKFRAETRATLEPDNKKGKKKATSLETLAAMILLLIICGVCFYLLSLAVNSLPSQEEIESRRSEKVEKYAPQYCDSRKNDSTRPYTVIEGAGIEIVRKAVKQGTELTIEDCKSTVYAMLVFDLDDDKIESVINMKYWVGMPSLILTSSIGMPDDVNSQTTSEGKLEQYIYGNILNRATYIYVLNNEVQSYQQF
jgi:hypothetical protein